MVNDLNGIINRSYPPMPWAEGDNIPWNEPGFSGRMLAEHLSQEHDLASRRALRVASQVEWIAAQILEKKGSRVLDLGCGPGLYTEGLAARGCTCHGIDFSPASIGHARSQAEAGGLACTYELADLRDCSLGEGFDLAMFIYGQFNVFRRHQASAILGRIYTALEPGGRLLLEFQGFEHIRESGQAPPSWYSCPSGLFSDRPHIVLQENAWHGEARSSVNRFSVIDAGSGQVETWSITNEAYSLHDVEDLLTTAGFTDCVWYPSLSGKDEPGQPDLPVVVALRQC